MPGTVNNSPIRFNSALFFKIIYIKAADGAHNVVFDCMDWGAFPTDAKTDAIIPNRRPNDEENQ